MQQRSIHPENSGHRMQRLVHASSMDHPYEGPRQIPAMHQMPTTGHISQSYFHSPNTGRPIQSVVTSSFEVDDGGRGPPPMPMPHAYYQPHGSFDSYYDAQHHKRSYYHHSRMEEGPEELPPDFMPPVSKRSKDSPASVKRDVTVANNTAPPQPTWRPAPYSPHRPIRPVPQYAQVTPSYYERFHGYRPYEGPPLMPVHYQESRDDYEENDRYYSETRGQLSTGLAELGGWERMKLVTDAAMIAQREEEDVTTEPPGDLTLLAGPEDSRALSEVLCVARENIEVFVATQKDVDAPAPGRKHAVHVGQVGLRCIHCRHTTRSSDRVKRAVCYPSSLKRIYRTVIDMKLDHFVACKYVPVSIKDKLNELKTVQTRSNGATMKYFVKAAECMGMVDDVAKGGIRLRDGVKCFASAEQLKVSPILQERNIEEQEPRSSIISPRPLKRTMSDYQSGSSSSPSISSESDGTKELYCGDTFSGCVSLAVVEDKMALSELRCFMRENVCAFSATADDISARGPQPSPLSEGQVGFGCKYCLSVAHAFRSNRACAFPFSLSRIYQAVADIQRFHFPECKNIPIDVHEKFSALANASSKGSKGQATRQYWITSARKIGLADTAKGIRFCRDPCKPALENKVFSLDLLANAAASITGHASDLVHESDRGTVSEFVLTVMEQLQPCRFSDSDNKVQTSKQFGCAVGVECKHCAGQSGACKFYWPDVAAAESNLGSVHMHLIECHMVPDEVKQQINLLKNRYVEESVSSSSKLGTLKVFFGKVWERLHEGNFGIESSPSHDSSISSIPSSDSTSEPYNMTSI